MRRFVLLLAFVAYPGNVFAGGQEITPGTQDSIPADARGSIPADAPRVIPAAAPRVAGDSVEERVEHLQRLLLEQQEAIRSLQAELDLLRGTSDQRVGVEEATPTTSDNGTTETADAGSDGTPTGNPGNAADAGEHDAQPPQARDNTPSFISSTLPGVKLSGSVLLFSYTPFSLPGAQPYFDLYGAHLSLDRDGDRIGFHLEPRFRSTKFRPYFDGTSWVQEAYIKANLPGGTLKVGRIYKQLGIFSDFAFYGDLAYFDGLKYNAEWGASYESAAKISDRFSWTSYAQYFRTDGRTNGSLDGRDIVSDPGSRRRNAVLVAGRTSSERGHRRRAKTLYHRVGGGRWTCIIMCPRTR